MSKMKIDNIMTEARNAKNAKKRKEEASKATRQNKDSAEPETAPSALQNAKDAPEPKTPKARKKATKDEGKMSGLDAAAKVLAEAGAPMNTRAMVETAAAKGYWASKAKTPWATIYAAILREINLKGSQARFKKTDRGLFARA